MRLPRRRIVQLPELQGTPEGRLLLESGALEIQGEEFKLHIDAQGFMRNVARPDPKLLQMPLMDYLWGCASDLAEAYGWAVVGAGDRKPLLTWSERLPLLTVRPEDVEAHLSTGQVLRAEVLHHALALAGILRHSRREEWSNS